MSNIEQKKVVKYSDYVIVEEVTRSALRRGVKEFLKRGYIPLGSLAVNNDPRGISYLQALVLPSCSEPNQ